MGYIPLGPPFRQAAWSEGFVYVNEQINKSVSALLDDVMGSLPVRGWDAQMLHSAGSRWRFSQCDLWSLRHQNSFPNINTLSVFFLKLNLLG